MSVQKLEILTEVLGVFNEIRQILEQRIKTRRGNFLQDLFINQKSYYHKPSLVYWERKSNLMVVH
jgi:hypothetical protein